MVEREHGDARTPLVCLLPLPSLSAARSKIRWPLWSWPRPPRLDHDLPSPSPKGQLVPLRVSLTAEAIPPPGTLCSPRVCGVPGQASRRAGAAWRREERRPRRERAGRGSQPERAERAGRTARLAFFPRRCCSSLSRRAFLSAAVHRPRASSAGLLHAERLLSAVLVLLERIRARPAWQEGGRARAESRGGARLPGAARPSLALAGRPPARRRCSLLAKTLSRPRPDPRRPSPFVHSSFLKMPHSFGYRARTRHMFKRDFRSGSCHACCRPALI